MGSPVDVDFDRPIPLFPLPSCVILPHTTSPLHIFEKRYREMICDVLADRKLVAMTMFAGDAWEKDYEGTPPLRPVVCVGYIVKHEKTPDGRYYVLLHGVCRARIKDELPMRSLYREAILCSIESADTMNIDLEYSRDQLRRLLEDPLVQQLTGVKGIRNWLNEDVPTESLVDLAAVTVCEDSEARYRLLAEPDAEIRAQWLIQFLQQARHTFKLAQRHESGAVDGGDYLN